MMLKSNKLDTLSLIALLFSAAVTLVDSLNVIALYIAIPLVFIYCCTFSKVVVDNKYIRLLLYMYLWICFTYLFSLNFEFANREMKQCLGVFLLCFIFSSLALKEKLLPWLYGVYIMLYLGLVYYASQNILSVIDISSDRLNDDKLNANTMAYYTFFITYSFFVLGDITKRIVSLFFKIIFIGAIALSFYIALLTASRQVLIIQVPLIFLLLYLRYGISSVKNKVILLLILSFVIFYVLISGIQVYNNSYLAKRSRENVNEDSRVILLEEALNVGWDNLLVGVGPGNFKEVNSVTRGFSHCTYTELFANSGFLAVYFYVTILLLFIKRQWRRYRLSKDKNYLSFIVFGCFFVIDNFFYIFHISLWLLPFFFLVATHSEIYYNKE